MAALVSIGGPGIAVAVADPGSHSSHSRDRDGRGSQRDGGQRNGSGDRRGDRGEAGQRRGADARGDSRNGRSDGPRDFTTGRDQQNSGARNSGSKTSDPRNGNTKNTSGAPAQSARTAAPSEQARGQSDEQVAERIDQQPPVVTVPEPPAAADTGGGGGGGGSVGAGVALSVAPPVVFGNGRTPGPADQRPELTSSVTVPVVAPAADVPAAVTPPAPPALTPLQAPTIAPRTMTPRLTPTAPASSVSSLWGLAGLILAPLAGVLLGYRQARANKAAAELKSALAH